MPDLPFADTSPPSLITATALNAPSSPTDRLWVCIPSMGASDRWEAEWTPHGLSLPTIGTVCLVALDENGHAWVVAWVGPWS